MTEVMYVIDIHIIEHNSANSAAIYTAQNAHCMQPNLITIRAMF